MKKDPPLVVIKGYAFERVDIFLRVKGRLPTQKGDYLSQDILDEYCKRYEERTLTEGMVSLEYMYDLIKSGKVKAHEPIQQETGGQSGAETP